MSKVQRSDVTEPSQRIIYRVSGLGPEEHLEEVNRDLQQAEM